MDLENLLKCIIETVQEEGARNIEGYEMFNDTKGIEFEIEGKKFDIRISEK